jgi:hypothetical protein
MPETTSFTETDGSLGEKLTDAAAQVKDKVSKLRRDAKGTINDNRDTAASGLEKAAAAVHQKAESLPGGKKVSAVAHATADRLTSTAEYVRGHDVDSCGFRRRRTQFPKGSRTAFRAEAEHHRSVATLAF